MDLSMAEELRERTNVIVFKKADQADVISNRITASHPTLIIGAAHLLAENEDIANAITV